jgi:signal recognition particle subunit SRP54
MFDNLSERLKTTFKNIRGDGKLTESNMQEAVRDVRKALLEADVALPVIKSFIDTVQKKALGLQVMSSMTPDQELVRVVRDELVAVMGEQNDDLNLRSKPPAVIMVAGLQGAGKTTSVAKMARFLKERKKKSVMLVSCDVYRPAAIDQLETLSKEVGVDFFPSESTESPIKIAKQAYKKAKKSFTDVLIIDTAGRLHVDNDMMKEISQLHSAVRPVETLFVVDSMTGQDAANTAKAFNDVLPLTGVILTKTDGDARGGAALSIRQITGKPIKFLGTGEKTTALEPFHPDRVASRILGMGDMLTLIEDIEHKVDKQKAQKLVKKLEKGNKFDFSDYLEQLKQMQNMGGASSLMEKMPGMGEVPDNVKDKVNDKEFSRHVAIICSMTKQERAFPAIIKGSRKKRITRGSGTHIQDLNKLMKQFTQMQKMMKKMSGKGGMKGMMGQLQGKMPPGMMPF